MSRRRRLVFLLASVAAAGALVTVLVLLYVPIAQEQSGYTAIGPRLNTFESVSLFGPNAAWQNFSYRGVTFGFHLWCQSSPGGGELCGNATEAGGAVYPYSFSDGPPSFAPPWQTWVSPNGHEAVQYRMGGLAHLLVEA